MALSKVEGLKFKYIYCEWEAVGWWIYNNFLYTRCNCGTV